DRFPNVTSYDELLAQYEAEPQVRVLFEVGDGTFGAGRMVPGAPVKRFETSFDSWPPPARPQTWYLDTDGALSESPPQQLEVDRNEHDPASGAITYAANEADFLKPIIPFNWPPLADGKGLSYLSEPLTQDTVVVGNGGYVDLWFASDAGDANVEV